MRVPAHGGLRLSETRSRPSGPLIDLHRHLDGNLRLDTVLELAERFDVALPAREPEKLRPYLSVQERERNLPAFLAKVELMASVLGDADACRRVAYENVEDAAREGLDYVELRFSPGFMARARSLDADAVVEAVVDGTRAGRRDFEQSVNLIGILSRTFGVEACTRELEALLTQRDHIVALDLAGDESLVAAREFAEHFRRARDVGWRVTVHAGEASGPESVWQAVIDLRADRIGHGVRAAEARGLLEYLASEGTGVECCLTSNVHTSTVASYEVHPVRAFLEAGIRATLNTDDPAVSGIDLSHEIEVAAPAAGLTPELISKAQENALEVSFLSREEKRVLARKL